VGLLGTYFSDIVEANMGLAVFHPARPPPRSRASAAGILADARGTSTAVALPGVVLRRDTTVGPGTSLLFAWSAFRFHNGKALVLVAAGSLTLAGASATNYVESDRPARSPATRPASRPAASRCSR
jgi:hypothetical protein